MVRWNSIVVIQPLVVVIEFSLSNVRRVMRLKICGQALRFSEVWGFEIVLFFL